MIKKSILLTIIIFILLGCSRTESIDPSELTWNEIQQKADGTSVRFYMWGGSAKINQWIDSYVAEEMKKQYNVELIRVPMDASVFVNKLITEKAAGKESGDIDLLWINGENFKNAKTADVLYGPYLEKLPNYKLYIDPETAQSDSGFPVEGYETPYGKAQFNFIYDSEKILTPPNSFIALLEWAKENPGLFTYPQPPDFTGSAFIRQAFYSLTGGYEQYSNGFNNELFEEKSQILWDYLNELEPYLWNNGKTYPRDLSVLDKLFQKGESGFSMSFTQTEAQGKINDGIYKDSVKSMVFLDGSLTNTHFTAIPFNSPNKPGALLLSDLLISPQVQLSKINPENWGDFTVLSMEKLNKVQKEQFENIDLGEATVSLEILDKSAVPEIPSEYLEALENGWNSYVLKK